MNDVILHAFNWRYSDIAASAEAIATAGYGAVLFPPVFWSDENGKEWWQIYQPKDYRILRSHLGRKADILDAIAKLKANGVRAYADVVFNHMANEDRPDHFKFPGEEALARYASDPSFKEDQLYGDLSQGLFTERDFHPPIDIEDWNNPDSVINQQISGVPDLTLSIAVVQEQITCLSELAKIGFEGFRVDAAKHLPVSHIRLVFQSKPTEGRFVFGEFLTFDQDQNAVFLWPAVQSTNFSYYDFPFQQILKHAFDTSGSLRELVDPAGMGNALPWQRALTFTVTHDLPNNDGFRGMLLDPQDEYLVNAYIYGRDGGVPMVYTDHAESAGAHPEDKGRWEDCWKRSDIAQMIGFHNAVMGLSQRSLWEDDGFFVFARGDRAIVAINKTNEWVTLDLWTWGLQWGDYRCQIHQHVLQVQGASIQLAIPPREVQMWLREE